MSYGLRVVSEVNNNNVLIDSTKAYRGMYTVSSGTVNHINSVNSSTYGVVYQEGDIVLFKPTGDVAVDSVFVITGRTILHSSSPKRYKVQFNIISKTGNSPSTVDFVVLRAVGTLSGGYGLQTKNLDSGYTVVTFDSRAFTTDDEIHIDRVYNYRFSHTQNFGTVNNGEYYNTTTLEWVSATGAVLVSGIVYSNRNSALTESGPYPNQISKGISHYGKLSTYGSTYYIDSDYTARGKKLLST